MSRFRTVNRPRGNSGQQAKIELCVTRQIFDFKNYKIGQTLLKLTALGLKRMQV